MSNGVVDLSEVYGSRAARISRGGAVTAGTARGGQEHQAAMGHMQPIRGVEITVRHVVGAGDRKKEKKKNSGQGKSTITPAVLESSARR